LLIKGFCNLVNQCFAANPSCFAKSVLKLFWGGGFMSEMIERVARAMCVQSGIDWAKQGEGQRSRNMSIAAAAIQAMREPTVEMLVAAQEDWLCVRAAEERGDFIWRAMIDTALV
jgi:hypothetical protein